MKSVQKGDWKLAIYKWHSFNLIPHVSMMALGDAETVSGQAIWLTVLGVVVMFSFPTRRTISFSMKQYGPLWSRRRKMWYRVD